MRLAPDKPIFTLISSSSGRRRDCVVVELDDGRLQPFYRSTGTWGHSIEGQWIPFCGLHGSWLIKLFRYKVPPPGTPEDAASQWLATQEIAPTLTAYSSEIDHVNALLGVVPRPGVEDSG